MTNRAMMIFFVMLGSAACCYDAPTVNPYPGPWLIDDFSHGNGYPSDPHFERWGCRPFDEAHPIADSDCNVTSDPAGTPGRETVLHLGARLYPPDNENDTFARAEVATYVRQAEAYDFRVYSYLLFSWKLVFASGDAVDLSKILLKVQLFCSRASDADGALSSKPFIVKSINPTNQVGQWNNQEALDLSQFAATENPPDDQRGEVTVDSCLACVDGIKITADSGGKPLVSAVVLNLYVDDIKLLRQQ